LCLLTKNTLYAGTDKALHALNSDGTDITIAAAGAASPITIQQTCSLVSTAIGATAATSVNCAIAIGNSARLFPGATGTVVLGNSSVGGTGACNSVVIGNSAQATCANTIAIGQVAKSSKSDSISIGLNSCANFLEGIAIGKNAKASNGGLGEFRGAIVIGNSACTITGVYGGAIVIGNEACSTTDEHVVIGSRACSTGSNYSVIIGVDARGGAEDVISIGRCANPSTSCSISIGKCARSSQTAAISIGPDAVACHTGSVALGSAITTVRTNTTHVNSLVAFGQAASLTNAVGSTGGSVTLNWDNSNIQTLTLTSNITTLTKSNPIDGAVYTLFLTQGGTGGKTVSWGTDVEWPGGTPPTLSTAIGATDAVSLVYIAGITGYYGNANLNFS
jgi:hypothetical protein